MSTPSRRIASRRVVRGRREAALQRDLAVALDALEHALQVEHDRLRELGQREAGHGAVHLLEAHALRLAVGQGGVVQVDGHALEAPCAR